MFSEIRVTHMAAYFLLKAGGRMAYLKLMKLLYLAERQSMAKWGDSISGDQFVSMPYGPVLSQTYDLITNGIGEIWNSYIQDEANCEVSIVSSVQQENLDEISPSVIKILDQIFDEFGQMSRYQISEYTHNYCSEWEDPEGSSFPISPESIFRAMGKNEEQVEALVERNIEQRQLDSLKALLH